MSSKSTECDEDDPFICFVTIREDSDVMVSNEVASLDAKKIIVDKDVDSSMLSWPFTNEVKILSKALKKLKQTN